MTKTKAETHARGARASWASNGGLWAFAAGRLLGADHFPEVLLGCVALHLALKNAVLLTKGRQPVPEDAVATRSCPFSPAALDALEERVRTIRDHIIHHADRTSEGGGFDLAFPAGVITATRVTKQGVTIEKLALSGAVDDAKALGTWFRDQLPRFASSPSTDLASKVTDAMSSLQTGDQGSEPVEE